MLYHFTARRLIYSIIRDGIRPGAVVHSDALGRHFIQGGYVWLTTNPSFDQAWDVRKLIPYSRTDIRIALKIGAYYRKNLIPWLSYYQRHRHTIDPALNAHGDPENWFLYKGHIHTSEFIEISERSDDEDRI